MKRTTLRYLLVIIIVIITAFILQYLKVINFIPRAFWISTITRQEMTERQTRFISSDTLPEEYDRVFIVYEGSRTHERNSYYHLAQTFRNAHIHHEDYDVLTDDIGEMLEGIPPGSHIILANEISEQLSDEEIALLEQLVYEGAQLSIVVRSYDARLGKVAGFSGIASYIETTGINFEEPIFPGLDETVTNPKAFHSSSLELSLSEGTEVLLTSDEGIPLAWKHPHGSGSVFYANTTIFQDKKNRGLLLQYLLDNADYGLATVFNKKIMNIDDFPAPLPAGRDADIYAEYHRDIIKFYKDIWWPDMRDLAAKYDLAYTGLIIGTYNDDTTPPFKELTEGDLENIEFFARKLDEIDGELGIHGYNHNSLITEGLIDFEDYNYNPWASKEDMAEALTYLRSEIEALVGEIEFRTYVPPSNLANRLSEEAVLAAFPELKVFGGLYTGSQNEKETLIQEFGPNPYLDGVYDFPRFSSGYLNENEMWSIYSAIAELGVFNHFIHPDDLLDPERSLNNSWEVLFKSLSETFAELTDRFPYLEAVTDYEAYLDYLNYEKMDIFSRKEGSTIDIWVEDAPLPTYAYLRVDAPIVDTDGITLHSLDRDGLYLIEIRKPESSVTLFSK